MSMLHRQTAGYVPRHQKTYLSREMTRAMALDHPIGDPHGGPAFGERNDPVSAIISIGTILATGAEVIAGTATLMQGLAFAGAAISLVGNVTGNKTLSKIGMITGIAGGVGMLAESAGMFTSGTLGETFGYGAGASGGSPAAPLSQTPDVTPAANPLDFGAAPSDVSSNIISQASPVAPEISTNVPSSSVITNPVSSVSPAATNLAGTPASELLTSTPAPSQGLVSNATNGVVTGAPAAPAAPAAPSAVAPSAPGTPVTESILKTANASTDPIGSIWQQTGGAVDPSYAANIRPMTAMESAWQGIKSIGGGFMDLAKSNPGAAYMLGMGITSVGDVLSGKAGAQVDALKAQGQLNQAQADKLKFELDLYKQKWANVNSGYANVQNPLANWTPPTGLVSGAMRPGTKP